MFTSDSLQGIHLQRLELSHPRSSFFLGIAFVLVRSGFHWEDSNKPLNPEPCFGVPALLSGISLTNCTAVQCLCCPALLASLLLLAKCFFFFSKSANDFQTLGMCFSENLNYHGKESASITTHILWRNKLGGHLNCFMVQSIPKYHVCGGLQNTTWRVVLICECL